MPFPCFAFILIYTFYKSSLCWQTATGIFSVLQGFQWEAPQNRKARLFSVLGTPNEEGGRMIVNTILQFITFSHITSFA
jgi:hypothetical protein